MLKIIRFCFVVLFGAILLSCSTVYAQVSITDEVVGVFIKVYPQYVELARNKNIMPSQDTMDDWGAQIEDGSFDFDQLSAVSGDVDSFRSELTNVLNSYGMTIEDFSQLAAKISVIYSNVTVQQALKEAGEAETASLSQYTKQFDEALSNVGISYSASEVSAVEKNIEQLTELFNKVLMGGV